MPESDLEKMAMISRATERVGLEWIGTGAMLVPGFGTQPYLRGEQVLVHTDNTATVEYINRQGDLRACCNSPATSSSGVQSI